MSEPRDPAALRAEAARRRRLAEIFGDVLPSQTADDRDSDPGDEDERGDEWLRRQVPPHHGGH